MKYKLIITFFSITVFISCKSGTDKSVNKVSETKIKTIFKDFDIYTPNGKLGKDPFGLIFQSFTEFITPKEMSDYFSYRDAVHLNYNQLDFGSPIDSMTIKQFLTLCQKNQGGGLIFNFKKSSKKLKMQIVGIKKYNNASGIEMDDMKLDRDTVDYRNYGRKAAYYDKKEPYQNFVKYPFIYFGKATTADVLSIMQSVYTENQKIYFYYGYSRKSVTSYYHPSILFSVKNNLEENRNNKTLVDEYAFVNRGGVCCPPQD